MRVYWSIVSHCNLDVEHPTGTHVNFDGNFSQTEYQIHFGPFTDTAYQTAFYSETLSCPVWLLDVWCRWSGSSVPLDQFPHLAVEPLFTLCFPQGLARGTVPNLEALQVCHDCGITTQCLCVCVSFEQAHCRLTVAKSVHTGAASCGCVRVCVCLCVCVSVCVCVCVCVFITTKRICRRSQALILREGCKRLSKLLSVATADYCVRGTQGKGGLDKPEVFE